MQTRVAEQGLRGREEANAGFRGFAQRGREMGSVANQNRAADQFLGDALGAYGNMNRMRETQMASMGVNPGDPRFSRGQDTDMVRGVAAVAGGANQARTSQRDAGLKLEGAGLTGLAGNDPTGALNGMSSSVSAAANRSAQADANNAAGWGQLAQGAMYGLKNGQAIADGWKALTSGFADGGYVQDFADGGEVRGIQRFASGGNVYDQAMQQGQQGLPSLHQQGGQQGGVNPMQAANIAKGMVDKVAESTLGHSMVPGLTSAAPGSQAAMLAAQNAGFGAEGLSLTSQAAAGATGLAEAGAGAGAAGALGAVGAALPWVGGAMLLGKALGLKNGGNVPAIGGKASGGRAQNPKGGKVKGPGGPKDDMVPARLSPGEFVMPVGTVRKYGLDRLERMRQEGLEFEQQTA